MTGLVVILPSPVIAFWAIKGGLLALLFAAWAFAPKAYRIEGNNIVVRRWIGKVKIPLSNLCRARRMPSHEIRGAIRTFGVGSCFGYYGKFVAGFEPQTWYVTDRESCVRVECPDGVVVVSPSTPDAFLAALTVAVKP